MPNNYFEFKQFTVWQQHTAMKVCTDSCIFGASLPLLNANEQVIKNVLDIGTGTGLLSLMYAQLNNQATITALEIEPSACKQAIENINNSIFKNHITVLEADILKWHTTTLFDLIIVNPPFYENEWQSNDLLKNAAHHSTLLSMNELVATFNNLMQQHTICAMLIPTKRLQAITKLLHNNELYIKEITTVYANEKMNDFRSIIFFQKKIATSTIQNTLTIKENNNYTHTFTALLQPFYLKL
jgi:tRNA1Val (adenine37-N6)-methyltransferase